MCSRFWPFWRSLHQPIGYLLYPYSERIRHCSVKTWRSIQMLVAILSAPAPIPGCMMWFLLKLLSAKSLHVKTSELTCCINRWRLLVRIAHVLITIPTFYLFFPHLLKVRPDLPKVNLWVLMSGTFYRQHDHPIASITGWRRLWTTWDYKIQRPKSFDTRQHCHKSSTLQY